MNRYFVKLRNPCHGINLLQISVHNAIDPILGV